MRCDKSTLTYAKKYMCMYTNLHKIKKKLKGPQEMEVVFGLQRDSEALRTLYPATLLLSQRWLI